MSRGILEETMDRTIEKLTGKYILIDQILIIGVNIPETLKRAIEAKLTQQQNVIQYDYVLSVARKEAERKRIEAEGIRDFQKIVTPGISPNFLRWKGIEATLDLSKSANAKVVVIGAQSGLPLILDTSSALPSTNPTSPAATKAERFTIRRATGREDLSFIFHQSRVAGAGARGYADPQSHPRHRNLWLRPLQRSVGNASTPVQRRQSMSGIWKVRPSRAVVATVQSFNLSGGHADSSVRKRLIVARHEVPG